MVSLRVEGEIFSGKPDFRHLLSKLYPPLGALCGLQRDINPFFLIKDLVWLLVPRNSADMREAKEWGERVRDALMAERAQLSTNFRLDSVLCRTL